MSSSHIWKTPQGYYIQGQAGKPYAHQAGPVLKYPCVEYPVDNGGLCYYKAYKYWAYYEYLSPQLQQITDVIVSDSKGFWHKGTAMGYKWKPLGSQYLGCVNKEALQDTNLDNINGWYPFGDVYAGGYNLYPLDKWKIGSTYNKASYKIPTAEAAKKLTYAQSTYLDRAVRIRYVNTYECCGGDYYCGSQIEPPQAVTSQSPDIYSTGNTLCAVDYIVTNSWVTTAKAVAKYSSQSSIKKYSQMQNGSQVCLRLYTEVPAGSSNYKEYCDNFAAANSSAAKDRGSFLINTYGGPYYSIIYTAPAIPTYKKYDQAYAQQAVSWKVPTITSMYQKPNGSYYPDGTLYGSNYSSNGGFYRISTVSLASDYFWSYSTEQQVVDAWNSIVAAHAPAESTIGDLQPLAITIGGVYSNYLLVRYPACAIDVTSADPPENVPDVQSQVWDSNYSFIKWDIWSIGSFSTASSMVKYPSLYDYYLQAPKNQLASGVFSSDLYEYQLFDQGWIKNNRFVSLRAQYPGKVFRLVQHGVTPNSFDLSSYTSFNVQYVSVGGWLDYYEFSYPAYTYASSYYTSALNAPAGTFDSLWNIKSFTTAYYAIVPKYIIDKKGTNSVVSSDVAAYNTSMQDRAVWFASTSIAPRELTNDKWVTVQPVSSYGPYSSNGSWYKRVTPLFNAGYYADPQGYYGCYAVTLTCPDKRYWYRAHKYVLACRNRDFYYFADQNQLQNSQYVHYIQYPAVKFDGQVLASFGNRSNYRSGASDSASVIDSATGNVSSVYVWYPLLGTYAVTGLSDSLLKDYTHNVTSKISQQGVDVYWSGIAPVSSRLSSGFLAASVYDVTNRYQDLVSAVSGTQCAFCVYVSRVYLEPQAQPQVRLGYTYVKFPQTVIYSTYYSATVTAGGVTQTAQSRWRGQLSFVSFKPESDGVAAYKGSESFYVYSVSSGNVVYSHEQLNNSALGSIQFSVVSYSRSLQHCSFRYQMWYFGAPGGYGNSPVQGGDVKSYIEGATYPYYSSTVQYFRSSHIISSNWESSYFTSAPTTIIYKNA